MIRFEVPVLETEHLRLRLPEARDLDAYAAFRASDRASFLGGPYGRAESFHDLSAIVGQWQLRGYGRWLVADKASDEALGIVGIFHPEDWPEPEIGWTVFAAGEGRGVAYEAAHASRRYAYETLGWQTIVSLVARDNARSVALAKRMGCTFERIYPHPRFGDLDVWRHPAAGSAEAVA